MGYPNRTGKRAPVPRKRDIGVVDEVSTNVSTEETFRRLVEPVAAAKVTAGGGGGGGGANRQQQPQLPQPPAAPIIDRWHKWSGSPKGHGGYVDIGVDDTPSSAQYPPPNPGYAPTGKASSIVAGYAMAVSMTKILVPGARVMLRVHGGYWPEDPINFDNPNVDVCGEGMPVIFGHIFILGTAKMLFENFEVISPDGVKGIQILPSPELAPFVLPYSDIKLLKIKAHGASGGIVSWRRTYYEDCETYFDGWVDYTLEDAPFIQYAAPDDIDWSIAVNCKFDAFATIATDLFRQLGPRGYRTHIGYAMKCSAKPMGMYLFQAALPFLAGNGEADVVLPTSGMMMYNCEVQGSILNEGWTVQEKWNRAYGGVPMASRSGGVHAVLRGWYNVPAEQHMPAMHYMDHCDISSAMVATAIQDPLNATPYIWGGAGMFRNSNHLCSFSGSADAAFTVISNGAFHVVNSATHSASWGAATTYGTCPTGVPILAMCDPYLNY